MPTGAEPAGASKPIQSRPMDDEWPYQDRSLRRRSSRRADDTVTVNTTDAVNDFEFRPSRVSTEESAVPERSRRLRRSTSNMDDEGWYCRDDGVWIRREPSPRRDETIIYSAPARNSSRSSVRSRRRSRRRSPSCEIIIDEDYGYDSDRSRYTWPMRNDRSGRATPAAVATSRAVRELMSSFGPASICNAFFAAYAGVALASVAAGLLVDSGAAPGLYIAILGGLLLTPLHSRHLQGCTCTREARWRDERIRNLLSTRHFERRLDTLNEDLADFREEVFDTFDNEQPQRRPSVPVVTDRRRTSARPSSRATTVYGEEQPHYRRDRTITSILRQDSNITLMSDSDEEDCKREQQQEGKDAAEKDAGAAQQRKDDKGERVLVTVPVAPPRPVSRADTGNDGFDDLKDEVEGKMK